MSPKDAGLIQRAAERRSDAWNRPSIDGEAREPIEQPFILAQRDVIEERVPTIQEPANPARSDVRRDAFRGVEVEGPPAVGLSRKRGNRVDAPELIRSHALKCHI